MRRECLKAATCTDVRGEEAVENSAQRRRFLPPYHITDTSIHTVNIAGFGCAAFQAFMKRPGFKHFTAQCTLNHHHK